MLSRLASSSCLTPSGDSVRISLFMAIKLTYLGQFFTNFMPSAVGGDLVRAWYVSRHTHRRLQAALGVLVDRLMGLMSTFVLAITSYLLFMRGQGVFHVSRTEPGLIGTFFDKRYVLIRKTLPRRKKTGIYHTREKSKGA